MSMTRNGSKMDIVRLSVRDWMGILCAVTAILVTIFTASIQLERRLTEVLVRQEQLEIRIERIEETVDRGALRP